MEETGSPPPSWSCPSPLAAVRARSYTAGIGVPDLSFISTSNDPFSMSLAVSLPTPLTEETERLLRSLGFAPDLGNRENSRFGLHHHHQQVLYQQQPSSSLPDAAPMESSVASTSTTPAVVVGRSGGEDESVRVIDGASLASAPSSSSLTIARSNYALVSCWIKFNPSPDDVSKLSTLLNMDFPINPSIGLGGGGTSTTPRRKSTSGDHFGHILVKKELSRLLRAHLNLLSERWAAMCLERGGEHFQRIEDNAELVQDGRTGLRALELCLDNNHDSLRDFCRDVVMKRTVKELHLYFSGGSV